MQVRPQAGDLSVPKNEFYKKPLRLRDNSYKINECFCALLAPR